MSGSINPAGLSTYSETPNLPWLNQSIFTVVTPSSAAAFTYGSGSIAWATTGGQNLLPNSVYIGSAGGIGIWNNTPGITTDLIVNSSATGVSGTQTITLPATPTDTLVSRTSTDTLTNKTISLASNAVTGLPADISLITFGKDSVRAVGTGDNPFGVKVRRAIQIKSIYYRALTADASGNLVVELRNNGSTISSTSATIAAASQVTGSTVTGLSANLAAGDILTVYVTGVGTTPGKGLVADIEAVTT